MAIENFINYQTESLKTKTDILEEYGCDDVTSFRSDILEARIGFIKESVFSDISAFQVKFHMHCTRVKFKDNFVTLQSFNATASVFKITKLKIITTTNECNSNTRVFRIIFL